MNGNSKSCRRHTVRRCWSCALEKSTSPCWTKRTRNDPWHSAELALIGREGEVELFVRLFELPRRTAYYRPCKAPPKVQERFEAPIKAMIDQEPSFGHRTVAGLLKFNKNTVQRIFQIRGWQVKQRPIGFRPRVQAMPSVAKSPDER